MYRAGQRSVLEWIAHNADNIIGEKQRSAKLELMLPLCVLHKRKLAAVNNKKLTECVSLLHP
jgi:hypothetical protein